MPLLDIFRSAFKGGEQPRVPLASGISQGWIPAFESGPSSCHYSYDRGIREGFLANPIAQRSVRLLTETSAGQ